MLPRSRRKPAEQLSWRHKTGNLLRLAALVPLLLACEAELGDQGHQGGSGGSASQRSPRGVQEPTCDPEQSSPGQALRRLSRRQAENTIDDLIARVLPEYATTIRSEMQESLATYPRDLPEGPTGHVAAFSRVDQTVHQEHIQAVYRISLALGDAFTQQERLTALAGDCATDSQSENDDACLRALIGRLGPIIQRRVLSEEDVTFYRESFGSAPLSREDYAEAVALLLNSPYAFYFIEHGSENSEEEAVVPLDGYELASRLSYHFWQSAPDDQLLAAAEDGTLLSPEGYAAEVERIFADEKTTRSLEEFYREWLHQPHIDGLNSRAGRPAFDAFAGQTQVSAELLHHMEQELADAGTYYSHRTESSFEDFFTSRSSFAKTDDLASIYGVPVWQGEEAPPEFPDEQRAGLITRAGLLANASGRTRPIMKGLFIRRGLLCTDVPPPPPEVMGGEPESSVGTSTRELVERLTEQPGTSCRTCHKNVINPLGFVTEGFDALGRVRSEQLFFDEEGNQAGESAIDVVTTPQVILGDTTETSSPAEVNDLILESGLAQLCFSRVYFRYTFGRAEDLDRDGCAIADMSERLKAGATLGEVLRSLALSPSFRTHNFED